ncbi:MAG TPA: glyceraldehyde-3-phosphate dehydrogenase, partial [Parapedobacter sp.]|nr:glyceraldehyde-3-phosphate dehydrogenase [Parapedobacter sp.]
TSTELMLFRKPLYHVTSNQVMAHHQYAEQVSELPITIKDTLLLAKAITKLSLSPSRIDLGRLAMEWYREQGETRSMDDFIAKKLSDHLETGQKTLIPKDVVLFGFGRIGRIVARLLISQTGKGEQLRLKAIVLRSCKPSDVTKRADLLRYDSVHGPFQGTIVENTAHDSLIINGQTVKLIESENPESINYTQYGIHNALVIDNTGIFRDKLELSRHLKSKGVEQVLLTAPGKGEIPNIVAGINDSLLKNKTNRIFSAASCTTNAIVPVLKVINENFGIEKGHIETIHAYTNDQNLLDNYHKKYRRGRSAAINLVITETGAGSAVAKVMPELAGKLTGNAVRVPTPNASLAILHLTLKRPSTKQEINDSLRNATLYGPLVEQLDYAISNELVSSDIIGNSHSSVIDSPATILSSDGISTVIYVWYDNECGYSYQVLRLAKRIANVVRITYY